MDCLSVCEFVCMDTFLKRGYINFIQFTKRSVIFKNYINVYTDLRDLLGIATYYKLRKRM